MFSFSKQKALTGDLRKVGCDMCQVCNDTGIVHKNMGFGIEIDKCPNCDTQENSIEELLERLEEVKRQLKVKGA